jgi:hypothetical protein
MNPTARRGVSALLMASVTLGLTGCGGNSDPGAVPAVPAAGTVTYKGQPVAKGTIQLVPEKGRPASGTIEGGRFTLSTYGEGDGAIPGKHKVAVIATEEVPRKQGEPRTKYLVPEKYASPDSAGVEIEVPSGGNKDLKIDLPG